MESNENELGRDEHGAESLEGSGQDSVGSEDTSNEVDELMDIHHGEALTCTECTAITFENRTQIVLIAGPAKSGKTTLIASLFHLFQRGPFLDYRFAGSQTLRGFDMR